MLNFIGTSSKHILFPALIRFTEGLTKSTRPLIAFLAVCAAAARAGEHVSLDSETALIALNGKSLMDIVLPEKASADVQRNVKILASTLEKMSGTEFRIMEGDGLKGIAVGLVGDFAGIPFKPQFDMTDPGSSQGYEIKSHKDGIYILAASRAGLEFAVYDFLFQLGYRFYFPTEGWEIIPCRKRIALSRHIRETPDYHTRNIWVGYGLWKEDVETSEKWCAANRLGGYVLNSGHAYEWIISSNKKEFSSHPEYYGLIGGERKSSKFCISNPGLRKLVSDFAVSRFDSDLNLKSFSVDPSDGAGWCECDACLNLGSPSTRAVFLANSVAEAVRKKYPDRRIGMYAYNKHSPPPEIDVGDNVVISIATAFMTGGTGVEDLIAGWREKKAEIGIREYYDVCIWSSNLPGRSRGSNLNYLKKTIPGFYNMGARYMSAESSDDWGPGGLGYYLSSRLLWNTRDSENTDAIKRDFLESSFGPVANDMQGLYDLLDGSSPKPLCSDLIGRMYRILERSLGKAPPEGGFRNRIFDLAAYVRYCELYLQYIQADGKHKTEAFSKLMEFTAATRNTRMVHSKGLYRESRRLCPSLTEKPAGDWERAHALSEEKLLKIISEGIAANRLLDFETKSFSDRLVPMKGNAVGRHESRISLTRRGRVTYYTWFEPNLKPLELIITGGLMEKFRDLGNVKLELWQLGGSSETGDIETLVQRDASISPNGLPHRIRLIPKERGLHKIIIDDAFNMTKVEWAQSEYVTIASEPTNPPSLAGSFYFYVAKNTKLLGFFCNMARGQIILPGGKTAYDFNNNLGYYSVSVPEGADGRIWKLQNIAGHIGLLTVPSCLALDPASLLLPEEVVKKDHLCDSPITFK